MDGNGEAPLLSIVLPTRNRAKYAGPTIESILKLSPEPLELIVHDNSSNDDLENYVVQREPDPRLRYFHIREPISGSENFELSTTRARGEFIGFLGDDDGVNPELYQIVAAADAAGLDAVLGVNAWYVWPDVHNRVFGTRLGAMLEIRPTSGRVSYPDPNREVLRCLRHGGVDLCDLPRVYHGAVRRRCLEKVREAAGCYFPGPCPDMAGAVAVSAFVSRYCKVDYPLFISGRGAGATPEGGVTIRKRAGDLDDYPFLTERFKAAWSSMVPRYFSDSTVWSENVVQALRATDREMLVSHLNLSKLHARCLAFEPQFASTVIKHFYASLPRGTGSRVSATLAMLGHFCVTWLQRTQCLAKNAATAARIPSIGFRRRTRIYDLQDTVQATQALVRELQARGEPPRIT